MPKQAAEELLTSNWRQRGRSIRRLRSESELGLRQGPIPDPLMRAVIVVEPDISLNDVLGVAEAEASEEVEALALQRAYTGFCEGMKLGVSIARPAGRSIRQQDEEVI